MTEQDNTTVKNVEIDISNLVDTTRVIQIEQLDPAIVQGRFGYRFIKRAFDIVSCCIALVICAIPMVVIAVLIKLDSPGPVFYRQERFGWSIIGQKSGAASIIAIRPALSTLRASSTNHPQSRLGVVA